MLYLFQRDHIAIFKDTHTHKERLNSNIIIFLCHGRARITNQATVVWQDGEGMGETRPLILFSGDASRAAGRQPWRSGLKTGGCDTDIPARFTPPLKRHRWQLGSCLCSPKIRDGRVSWPLAVKRRSEWHLWLARFKSSVSASMPTEEKHRLGYGAELSKHLNSGASRRCST